MSEVPNNNESAMGDEIENDNIVEEEFPVESERELVL